jgi:RNA polymerase sigma factor (TIGR02999 family)
VATEARDDVTALLRAWTGGETRALDQLMPVLYAELRRTAAAYMRRERAGHSLQATALVNEAFLRLVDVRQISWHDRTHFFTLAAQQMRRILVDHARSRGYQKRGGRRRRVELAESAAIERAPAIDILALDEALDRLKARDERKSRVVELRFFGGLSVEETAAALDVSPQTVLRDWSLSKAWLQREMNRTSDVE